MVFPILEQLGLRDRVRFVRADYRWKTPWADFKVDSLDHVQQAVTAAFPASRGELEAYFKDLRLLVRGIKLFSEHPNPLLLPGWRKLTASLRLFLPNLRVLRAIGAFTELPGLELARRHFSDPRLVEFFGHFGYTGSSAVATAGAWGAWLFDYWYPLGGLQGFADILANSFTDHGGEVRYRTRVVKVLVEGTPPRATGVLTEGGEVISARYVVSAGDHRRLALDLLPEEGIDPAWRAEAAGTPLSDPIFCVYLGVDLPRDELQSLMQAHHVFVRPEPVPLPTDDDPDWHAHRWVEVSSPSLVDPSLAPPGKSSLILQCFSSYAWRDRWGTGRDQCVGPGRDEAARERRRTPEYRELKTRVTRQLIRTAEPLLPGLSRKIVVQDAATPLTLERYTLNSEGATAGWTWDPRRNPIKSMAGRYQTPVANLLEAGHWTARIGGVPSAALSARMVSDLIR